MMLKISIFISRVQLSYHECKFLWSDDKRNVLCCEMDKWKESGFRPLLCTYRLNWARRTSWGWWDDWDDTVLQTQDSKFEPWWSEDEHATSRWKAWKAAVLTTTLGPPSLKWTYLICMYYLPILTFARWYWVPPIDIPVYSLDIYGSTMKNTFLYSAGVCSARTLWIFFFWGGGTTFPCSPPVIKKYIII